jgi:hypothetical protein
LHEFIAFRHEIGNKLLDFATEKRYYRHIGNKKLQISRSTTMKNMPQVRKGQFIETPHGAGFVSFMWPMQVGERTNVVAYFVFLITPRPPEFGMPLYESSELRPLNPGIFFPEHKGEILR